jgi:hypothetical protein
LTNPIIRFVTSVCVQTAVYWGAPTPDGYGGYTYADPTEISCRWDGKVQLIRAANGEEVVSNAEVLVTQDVDEGGYLYLGTLDDFDSDDGEDPRNIDGAAKIISIVKTPLFRSTDEFVRQVFL